MMQHHHACVIHQSQYHPCGCVTVVATLPHATQWGDPNETQYQKPGGQRRMGRRARQRLRRSAAAHHHHHPLSATQSTKSPGVQPPFTFLRRDHPPMFVPSGGPRSTPPPTPHPGTERGETESGSSGTIPGSPIDQNYVAPTTIL